MHVSVVAAAATWNALKRQPPGCQVEQKTVPDAPRQQAEVAQLIHAEVHWHLIADWAGSRVRVRVSGPGPSPNI